MCCKILVEKKKKKGKKMPKMTKVERANSFHEVPLYYGVPDLDEDEEYERWMMEDHPLRAYPTDCCPGLSRWASGVKAGRLFRLVCVVVTIVYVSLRVKPRLTLANKT